MAPTMLTTFLRRVLLFDAATCVIMAALLLVGGGILEQLLAIPAVLSRAAAVVLLIFGAAVAWVGMRSDLRRSTILAIQAIIVLNALWAVESILALVFGWLEPNVLGQWFIVAQAAAVALIAELQFIGLRRARPVTA